MPFFYYFRRQTATFKNSFPLNSPFTFKDIKEISDKLDREWLIHQSTS